MTARLALSVILLAVAAVPCAHSSPGVPVTARLRDVLRVPSEYPTVWDAVVASAPHDTVLVAPGTYVHGGTWEGGFAIARVIHPLTIRSEGGSDVTALELPAPPAGGPAYGIFAQDVLGDLVIEGFTLRSPFVSARAVALLELSGARITDCRFEGFRGISGSAIYADDTPVTLDGCVFTGCSAPEDTGAIYSSGSRPLELFDSRMEMCTHPLRWRGAIDVRDTRFERNEGTIAHLYGPGALTRCEFRENTVLGAANELAYLYYMSVTECVFTRNVAFGYQNRVSVFAYHSDFERCLFVDNYGDPPAESAAYLPSGGSFRRNVVVGNRGARAVRVGSNVAMSCNLFWDNPNGHVYPGGPSPDQGWVVDPQFCDREADDYTVMSTSPCLAENAGTCGTIGPFPSGCESRGFVINTEPEFLDVVVQGVAAPSTAPVYVEGAEGTQLTVSIDPWQTVAPGKREVFDAWSDGGARTHDATVGPPGSVLTAFHHREHELIMAAQPGGVVTPGTSWYPVGAPVEIGAWPEFPAWFTGWVGTGPGSYTGPDPVTTVLMDEPMSQIATFSRYWEVTITSDPPGARLIADGSEFEAPHVFHWRQGSQHVVEAYADREYSPGERLVFTGWSSGSQSRIRTVDVGSAPMSLTALHAPELLLAMEAQGPGTVTPGTSWHAVGAHVPISAVTGPGSEFDGWLGEGDGSYSGPDANASVTMNTPITQTATFRAGGAAFVLSLSDTDPDVAVTSTPLGLGEVHLWLECAEGEGIAFFQGRVAGDLTVLGFLPVPGVINAGSHTDLSLSISGCPNGPVRLGALVVQDASGGALCLEPDGGGLLQGMDCTFPASIVFAWPATLRVRGITTDGSPPCESGAGCGGGGGVRRPAESRIFADGLRGARPNPVVGSTTLEFALGRGGPARLDVYDVTGRLVRRLAEGPRSAGDHRVTWDRRDGQGGRTPAGVYFVRLTTADFAQTRKVLVLD